MSTLIQNPTRILFFTGKGGVGKVKDPVLRSRRGRGREAAMKPVAHEVQRWVRSPQA